MREKRIEKQRNHTSLIQDVIVVKLVVEWDLEVFTRKKMGKI